MWWRLERSGSRVLIIVRLSGVVTGVYGRLMTVPYHHQLLSTRLVTLTIKCQSNQINQYSYTEYKASSSKV